uniref:Uncharacterized protein n=1 Tax=Trieres chinensis TaxID=1514140 RepID=A0A7S2EVH9_TRICV|mmetsp:Transcript_4712/g.9948  ORF Transcript_4712/g.9948 Transcript_4712/m.9948 type:complete len:319 (+) Transcript_4712:162-1118(+)|eukprot:CAMPEP_0183290660 /NCGR_PEP_ID=MMETSP0160_2-20130417/285_1 /TAXON_ID=2839 ORGANISM="Odontella Sinensis, Strain Grunow 1884" /NCGR_SAMPLE_ID=MMETSP0160_2 /ASSEMBLY_ACC=CAM_ASM_000250 /LENGTH=318 /DNA_ID=CAMNT_0025451309 /DNA_START=113 /DNA_END=1069 /DNA_ORIENTATION=+
MHLENDQTSEWINDASLGLRQRLWNNDPTLTKLVLEGQRLGDDGLAWLAESLQHNTVITELWLWDNEIGDRGIESLSQVLMRNSSITRLELGRNSIGNKGAWSLAEALRENEAMVRVVLYCNMIKDAGAKALAKALVHNRTLKELCLCKNHISDVGAEAFSLPLKLNGSLSWLNLCDNEISEGGKVNLAEAMRSLTDRMGQNYGESFGEGFFGDSPQALLGPKEIAVLRRHLFSPGLKERELELWTGATEVDPEVFKKKEQPELLRILYRAGLRWAVGEDSHSVLDAAAPLMLGTVGSILGTNGIFEVILKRPGLFKV